MSLTAKIALLFMTYSDVNHQDYWDDFLNNHNDHYSVYVHSVEPLPEESTFKMYEIASQVKTSWGHTMRAQIELLKVALEDPYNTKFVFLSGSTLPLQDFDTIYGDLTLTEKSIFPFCQNPHSDPTRAGTFWGYHNYQPIKDFTPVPKDKQIKHPHWIVLNRKHAQLIVEDETITAIFDKYICDNEHYFGTFLALEGLLNEVENRQTTYDDWIATSSASNPYTFTNLEDEKELKLITKAIKGGLYNRSEPYLFGRKFDAKCNLSPIDDLLPYRNLEKVIQ